MRNSIVKILEEAGQLLAEKILRLGGVTARRHRDFPEILQQGVVPEATSSDQRSAAMLRKADVEPTTSSPDAIPHSPARGGAVSSQVNDQLEQAKEIARQRGFTKFSDLGNGVLWANKAANYDLMTAEQVAKVKALGLTKDEVRAIRDYYSSVDHVSGGRNPSAGPRADLLTFYLDNWE